jgi:hypothetical protein
VEASSGAFDVALDPVASPGPGIQEAGRAGAQDEDGDGGQHVDLVRVVQDRFGDLVRRRLPDRAEEVLQGLLEQEAAGQR